MAAPLASQTTAQNTRSVEAELQKLLPQVAQLVNGTASDASRGKVVEGLNALKAKVEKLVEPGATTPAPVAPSTGRLPSIPAIRLFANDTFASSAKPMLALF